MPSLIQGFECDIFISYRQKDNKGDRWVSEFVDALKTELESTFKEEISVYFDINPHDGLLETHDVNASLKEKLKCLIFIPIISQTYCDPKSFAWQNEFVAFNRMAKQDQFGRDIRLTSGNVASRILPVKIHDLDDEDKALLEYELGGVLRCIEFIYKSAGVNRPLKPTDSPDNNLNKTYYRDQVNKIANAIKEIICGLKKPLSSITKPNGNNSSKISKSNPESFESIAVLPFANISSDPEQEYFSDGISEEIINMLAQVPGLKVAGRTSAFSFKGKNQDLRLIGEQLNVNHILEGSVRKSGNKIRITAQLIKVADGYHLWSEKYDRELEDIFDIQDEISFMAGDYEKELEYGKRLVELEPNFYGGHTRIGGGLMGLKRYKEAVPELEIAVHQNYGSYTLLRLGLIYGLMGEKVKARELLEKMENMRSTQWVSNLDFGVVFMALGEFDNAFQYFKKAIEIHEGLMLFLKYYIRLFPEFEKDPRTKQLLEKIGLPY